MSSSRNIMNQRVARPERPERRLPAVFGTSILVIADARSRPLIGGAGGNRTPVHKSYATRSTYVATSIVLTTHYPTGRESARPARYFFVEHTPDTCAPLSDERYTRTFASARAVWVSTAIRRLERSCLDWQL